MQDITLTFTYTKEQIKNLHHFSIFPTQKSKYSFAFVTFVVFGLAAIVYGLEPLKSNIILFSVLNVLTICIFILWCLMISIVAIIYFLLPNYAFKNNPEFKGTYTILLSENNFAFTQKVIDTNGEKETNATVNWTAFTKKAENETFVILYENRKIYAIPKIAFASENELIEYKRFLTEQTYIKPKIFSRTLLWQTDLEQQNHNIT